MGAEQEGGLGEGVPTGPGCPGCFVCQGWFGLVRVGLAGSQLMLTAFVGFGRWVVVGWWVRSTRMAISLRAGVQWFVSVSDVVDFGA